MSADRPRAWQYMGAERWTKATYTGVWLDPGDIYIDTEPLTSDDIPLAPPVEVTAEDVFAAMRDAYLAEPGDFDREVARLLTERLAARQEGE